MCWETRETLQTLQAFLGERLQVGSDEACWQPEMSYSVYHRCPPALSPIANSAKLSDLQFQVTLTHGFIRTLYWINSYIWSHPFFATAVGDITRLDSPLTLETEIPPGFELIWYDANCHGKHLPPIKPSWLDKRLTSCDDERLTSLRTTFRYGLLFVTLHEVAHIVLGHTNEASSLGMKAHHPTWEIDADRWAFVQLYDSLGNSEGNEKTSRYMLCFIGVVVTFLIQHAVDVAVPAIARQSSYPPLSVRGIQAKAIQASLMQSAISPLARTTSGDVRDDWQQLEAQQISMLSELANTHPLIGCWLNSFLWS